MVLSRHIKLWGSLILVVLFFLTTSYLARKYQESLSHIVSSVPLLLAVPLYVIVIALLTVVAPTASLALVPVAGQLWGGLGGGLATGVGWIGGGVTAFFIARIWGQRVASHLASPETLKHMQGYIPREGKHLFWLLTVLEVLLPVDVLSYSVGLFTPIGSRMYAGALTLGNVVSGILFAYLGTLPLPWELAVFGLGGVLIAASLYRKRTLFL